MKAHALLLVIGLSFYNAGCCHYPSPHAADNSPETGKAILASPSEVEAYLGSSIEKSRLKPPIKCPPSVVVHMAPVFREASSVVRFGAFAVRHGDQQEYATAFWWGLDGKLRRHTVKSTDSSAISFIWVNHRTIRFQWGKETPTILIVRLNDDDGDRIVETIK